MTYALYFNCRDKTVNAFKQCLNKILTPNPNLALNNLFDKEMQAAVVKFQTQNGMAPLGLIDQITAEMIFDEIERRNPSRLANVNNTLSDIIVFVVSNIDELERLANIPNSTFGYQEPGSEIYQCARLPLAWQNDQEGLGKYVNRGNRLSENWIMGDAVTDGMSLSKGTVLATFDRSTGRYAQTNAGQGGSNHTVIFLKWDTEDKVKGMSVVEQRNGPAKVKFIPFNSANNYANDAGKFSVVKIKVIKFNPNFIDNNTRRTIME